MKQDVIQLSSFNGRDTWVLPPSGGVDQRCTLLRAALAILWTASNWIEFGVHE